MQTLWRDIRPSLLILSCVLQPGRPRSGARWSLFPEASRTISDHSGLRGHRWMQIELHPSKAKTEAEADHADLNETLHFILIFFNRGSFFYRSIMWTHQRQTCENSSLWENSESQRTRQHVWKCDHRRRILMKKYINFSTTGQAEHHQHKEMKLTCCPAALLGAVPLQVTSWAQGRCFFCDVIWIQQSSSNCEWIIAANKHIWAKAEYILIKDFSHC